MSEDHGHHHHHMAPAMSPPLPTTTSTMAHQQGGGGGGEHMHDGGGMHMMQMYFHAGYEPYVLIKQWAASDATAMLLTCGFFFILAILYELLKAYRRVLAVKIMQQSVVHLSVGRPNPDGGDHLSAGNREMVVQITSPGSSSSSRCGQSNSAHNSSWAAKETNGNVQSVDSEVEESLTGGGRAGGGGGSGAGRSCPGRPQQPQSSSIDLFSSWSEMFTCSHLRSTLLYLLQVMFAYLLMLAFMLFNVWIAGAILAGAAVGHFLISQKAVALQDATNEDSCH